MSNPFADLTSLTLDSSSAGEPDACVIWLHGLGASCRDFADLLPELGLDQKARIRFIFPQAPTLPVTVNGGYQMPAWYDLLSLGVERKFNAGHLAQASEAIAQLIDQQLAAGICSRRILLAGFSQGGAVAYDVALNASYPLAGLMALSTYFASHASCRFGQDKSLPISVQHGLHDDVVLPCLADQAEARLKERGFCPESHRYGMGHEVCRQQLADIRSFIHRCLPVIDS